MDTLDKISDLLIRQGKRQKDLTDFLGIDKSAFATWKSGKTTSYNRYIPQIASFFGVSVDYLLGRSDNPTMTTPPADIDTSTADGAALLAIYNRLSPVDRAKLLLYADNLSHNGGNDGNGSKDGGD